MKLLLPLLLLLSFSSLAQQSALFVIDSIPKHGVLLDKGWRYKEGDNPDWAKSDFNDSSWESIDPIKELALLPHVFNHQIKWLRIHFEIKDSLPKLLGLAVNQAGASEIYLNGKLGHRFGHFDTKPDKVRGRIYYHVTI